MPWPIPALSRWTHPAVILVATDLSDLERLMPFALDQAHQSGARLILLHASATAAAMSVDAVGMPYYDPSAALEFAEKELRPWCEAARRQNVQVRRTGARRPCDAADPAAARQFQADRILLGTRSRSRLGKMLLGSVAEQVLRSVNLPVINRGTRGSSPGGTVSGGRGTRRAACHHVLERPLARAQRLPARWRPV
jgi:nucleotide-binding universal stress UspA family protein